MIGVQKCQPEAAAPYQHVCPDADCCYYGQPSFRGCGCYRTREQMMSARIDELTGALGWYSYQFPGPIGSVARKALAMPLEQEKSHG